MKQQSHALPSTLIRRLGVDAATAADQFTVLSLEQILKSNGSARNAGTKDTSATGKVVNGTILGNHNWDAYGRILYRYIASSSD